MFTVAILQQATVKPPNIVMFVHKKNHTIKYPARSKKVNISDIIHKVSRFLLRFLFLF